MHNFFILSTFLAHIFSNFARVIASLFQCVDLSLWSVWNVKWPCTKAGTNASETDNWLRAENFWYYLCFWHTGTMKYASFRSTFAIQVSYSRRGNSMSENPAVVQFITGLFLCLSLKSGTGSRNYLSFLLHFCYSYIARTSALGGSRESHYLMWWLVNGAIFCLSNPLVL